MKVKPIKCFISIKLKTTVWILSFLKLITMIVLQRERSNISTWFNQKSRGWTYPTNFFKKGTVASEVDELLVEEPGKLQVKRWIVRNLTGQHNALTHSHIQVACWTRDHSCFCKRWAKKKKKTCHIIITASYFGLYKNPFQTIQSAVQLLIGAKLQFICLFLEFDKYLLNFSHLKAEKNNLSFELVWFCIWFF